MKFLPDNYDTFKKDANTKSNGAYLKFVDGDTRFRVLDTPIMGRLGWADKKPYRIRIGEAFEEEFPGVKFEENGKSTIKPFWAIKVYNVAEESIDILEITQKSVREPIEAYIANADYGDPSGYDITVSKSGKGLDTEYRVIASPPKPLDPAVKKLSDETVFNLDALFDGGDPFKAVAAAGEAKATEEDLPF